MKRSILIDRYGRSKIAKAVELMICLVVWAIPLTCAHYIDTKLYAADTQLARMNVGVMGAGASAAAGDSCTGDLLFSWHCENTTVTSGTPPGCSAGDTTATAAEAAVIDTDGTPTPPDGAGTCSFPTKDDNFVFAWASGDIWNMGQGTITFWLYVDNLVNGANLATFYVDSNNRVYIRMATGPYIYMDTRLDATNLDLTTTSAFSLDAWTHVIVRWSTTHIDGTKHLEICTGATDPASTCVNSTTAIGTGAGTSGTVTFGDLNTSEGVVFFMDKIKIYNVWKTSF